MRSRFIYTVNSRERKKPKLKEVKRLRRRLVIEVLVIGMMMLAAQENTGADIFRIEPETPYPTDLDTLAALGAEKQDNNARPALKSTIENLDQYDTVFVGYPN